MATFGDVWRSVRLQVPDAPALLVQRWVQDAYNALADRRGWAWLRTETQLTVQASRAIEVGVTNGQTTVTSAGLFVAGDAGRQFKVGSYPTYTIQTFTDVNTVVLDQAFAGTTDAAATATILDAFVTCPADFGRWLLIADPANQRLLSWWTSEEEIHRLDPSRTAAGPPRLLVARAFSTYTPTLGRVQYEWWPHPSAAAVFPALYSARPATLGEDTELRGVLAQRSDVLEIGALARCARWPGTAERPNPYFNLVLGRSLQEEFERLAIQIDLRDDDQYAQSWSTIPWHRYQTWELAYDTAGLRATDATLGDYYAL